MSEQLLEQPVEQKLPRTSDAELLAETMPEVIELHKKRMLLENDGVVDAHINKIDINLRLAEIESEIEGSKALTDGVQAEADSLSEELAQNSASILDKLYEVRAVNAARRLLGLKPTERQVKKSHLSELHQTHGDEIDKVEKLTQQLSELSELSETTNARLNGMLDHHFTSSEIHNEATLRAVEAMQEKLREIRAARDVEAMSEREGCLVFHTLLPKTYKFGGTRKAAPVENSPLNYDVAAAGGVKLEADIAMGYDIELSCSTIRECSRDAIWPGAGGFIIGGGSVRLAADCDLGSTLDHDKKHRKTTGASGSVTRLGGMKDNYIRTEEDLHFAVAGSYREISGNHNELVVESPDIAGVFINIADDAQIIWRDEAMGNEFLQSGAEDWNGGVYLNESCFQDLIDIASENELPIYAIHKGRAYRIGPTVRRVKKYELGDDVLTPFREITLVPEEVPFEQIRSQKFVVSDEQKSAAKARVPLDVFK